jgi:hypothetical protein
MPSSASHVRYAGCRCRTERVLHRARTPRAPGANPLGAARPGWGGHSRSTGHAAPPGRTDGGSPGRGATSGKRARLGSGITTTTRAAERRAHYERPDEPEQHNRSSLHRRPTRPPPFAPPVNVLHPDPLPAPRVASTAHPPAPHLSIATRPLLLTYANWSRFSGLSRRRSRVRVPSLALIRAANLRRPASSGQGRAEHCPCPSSLDCSVLALSASDCVARGST